MEFVSDRVENMLVKGKKKMLVSTIFLKTPITVNGKEFNCRSQMQWPSWSELIKNQSDL